MVPVIALVGRPNVGKSTLFNRLTRSREALVADVPGLTRDRKYGTGQFEDHPFIVVDTGGLMQRAVGIEALIAEQVARAIEEASAILFLLDARAGLSADDEVIAQRLRQTGKPVLVVVNKAEGLDPDVAVADSYALGLGAPYAVSAAHGHGVAALMAGVFSILPVSASEAEVAAEHQRGVRIAIVGRPNVGKSTLVNRMLGEDRVVVSDLPGTTRDSIFIPFERDGHAYVLIDTAGVRRRARVRAAVEQVSVIKTLQSIQAANVVITLLDASEGVTDQDLHLLGHVLEAGRALVVAVNKWDGLAPGQRDWIRRELDRKLGFVGFARTRLISALHGTGVGDLFAVVDEAYAAAMRDLATPLLTRVLENAVTAHPPPLVRGRRIKLRYAHQGGSNPPLIVVHGTQAERVPEVYRRYLVNTFRETLGLAGTPINIEFRSPENPFKNRRNAPTPRQSAKRRRGLRRVRTWK